MTALWAPLYESYNKMISGLPGDFYEHPDNAAVTAHFFTLCIDNTELISETVSVEQLVSA